MTPVQQQDFLQHLESQQVNEGNTQLQRLMFIDFFAQGGANKGFSRRCFFGRLGTNSRQLTTNVLVPLDNKIGEGVVPWASKH